MCIDGCDVVMLFFVKSGCIVLIEIIDEFLVDVFMDFVVGFLNVFLLVYC